MSVLKTTIGTVGIAVALAGCAAEPVTSPVGQLNASILASSVPGAGSMVREPVDSLELHFNPPARLDEIIVRGPAGAMPMMVHAVGTVAHYSLPLSGIGPGKYQVEW